MTVEEIAKALDISIEEVEQMQEDDKKIDKGEKLFELPKELEKGSKKARQVSRKVGVKQERVRAEDRQKRFLIDTVINALNGHILGGAFVEIINPEREILFEYCGKKYKIVLSCPRS